MRNEKIEEIQPHEWSLIITSGQPGGEGKEGVALLLCSSKIVNMLRQWPRSASLFGEGPASLRSHTAATCILGDSARQRVFPPSIRAYCLHFTEVLLTRAFQSGFLQILRVLNKYFRNCHETRLHGCGRY